MKKITIEDLLKFRFIQNLSFNPKGNNYAYELVHIDKKKDEYFTTVCVNKKAFTFKKSTSLLTWKDNEHLLIKEENTAKNTLYNKYSLLDINDGKRKNLFSTPLNLSDVKVIDENTLVFTSYIDANHPDVYKYNKEKLQKYQEDKKKEADYEVLDEIPYWMNGAGFLNKKRKALFVCNIKPLKIERITDPLFNVGAVEVKDHLVYFSGSSYKSRMPLYDKIFSYDLKSEKTKCLYDKADQMIMDLFVFDEKLCVLSTDGKSYGINETAKFHELKNNELIDLPSYDRSLYNAAAVDTTLGAGKGKVIKEDFIYTLACEKDHIEIWRLDKKFKKTKLISMPLIST